MTTHCLHIGIDDYSAYAPGHDLPGSVNDAEAWAGLLRESGVDEPQITVLTDGAATRAGIEAAVRALGRAVSATDGAGGLITFSGHGVASTATGADGVGITAGIVPSDVARDDDTLDGVITVGELEQWLGHKAGADTTIVIDACYTVPTGDDGEPLETLRRRLHEQKRVSSRLFLAAQPWEEAYQVQAGTQWRGALSFAMVTLLQQWTVHQTDAGSVWFNVSCGDLAYRTQQLLGVLGVDQTLMLLGPPRYALVPFLRPGLAISKGETSSAPDKKRPGSQLSHGDAGDYRVYFLNLKNSAGQWLRLGTVVVARTTGTVTVGSSQVTYEANTEYWYPNPVDNSKLPGISAKTLDHYRLKLAVAEGSWTSWSVPAAEVVGGGIPDAVASYYASSSWPPSSLTGTSLGCAKRSAGKASFQALQVQVQAAGSSQSVLSQVAWFNSTAGTDDDGLTAAWAQGDAADFGTLKDPATEGWPWYLKAYGS